MDRLLELLKYVSVGTVSTLVPMAIIIKMYGLKLIKILPVALFSAIIGTASTHFWFFIENGYFFGISFYGSVFIVPIFFFLGARMFREKASDLLDIITPGMCTMLAVMKVSCLLSGCCGGRDVCMFGSCFVFPSQIAELVNALVLMLIMLILAATKKYRGKLYPLFMVLYGVTRFVLNIFRRETVNHTGFLPPWGAIWSIVSIIIGIVWLSAIKKNSSKVQELT